MTEAQRYAKLRELLPFATGSTVDELIESQAKFNAQQVYIGQTQAQRTGPSGLSDSHSHRPGDFDRPSQQQTQAGERTWHTQQLYQSPQGATLEQVPPGDKP